MPLHTRWKVIAESQFPWEREALEFVRERLPDHEPWRAWANFEFTASDGTTNEIDLMVLSPRGLFLVEIKSREGVLSGDQGAWTWTLDGRRYTEDNPLILLNKKAKRLKSLLFRWVWPRGAEPPYIEPLVFCSKVTEVKLNDTARARLCLRDREARPEKPERPGIVKALTERIAEGLDPYRATGIDATVARNLSRAMEAIGIRPSRRSQEVRGYRLDRLLDEGPAFQDRLGIHARFETDRRRIRHFVGALGESKDKRILAIRAAEREYQILRGLDHAGILKPTEFAEVDHGAAILFEYDDSAIRLDHFMREMQGALDVNDRLSLARQIAEVVRYAHQRKVTHRALCPQSILVLNPSSPQRRIQVFNWQVGAREGSSSSTASTTLHTITATSHVEQLLEDAAAVYRAPEGLYGQIEGNGEHLDIFSLGALAYFLFSGAAPGTTPTDVAQIVRDHNGLMLSAVIDGANEHLQNAVRYSTQPLPGDRYATVDEFLDELTQFEEDITAPDEDALVDPAEAGPGATIEHGLRVEKRLGSGSTATAFLVRDEKGDDYVLKVANTLAHNEQLKDEAAALQKLRHHHIVSCKKVLHFKVKDGARVGILLQNAGADTLGQKIHKEGRYQVEFLERFGEDLLNIVQYLEDHGVFHRDIKPDNIGITELRTGGKRHLVLFDFSLSNAAAEKIQAGTRPYLDPFLKESNRKRYDSHAERYAAAVTLYEMSTGALPKWGEGDAIDPFVTRDEVTLDSDLMDRAVAEPLTRFFRKALARSVKDRYDNTESMLKAWRAVFSVAGKPIIGPEPTEAADEPALPGLRGLDAATPETPLASLGFSTRALNALERFNIQLAREFLQLPLNRWTHLPGVGVKTRNELHRAFEQLRTRFPDLAAKPQTRSRGRPTTNVEPEPDAVLVEVDTEPQVKTIDYLCRRLVGRVKNPAKQSTVDRVIPMLLGLTPLDESAPPLAPGAFRWPSQTDIARAIDLTRARISQVVGQKRETWKKDSVLVEIRDEITNLLNNKGGAMTAAELAGALLAARGSISPNRDLEALAVVRAAVEAEAERADDAPRYVVHRAAAGPGDSAARPRVIIARSLELADYAVRIAKALDELAAAEPLPSAARAVEVLASITSPDPGAVPDGVAPLEPARRLSLAAAASVNAAVNDRFEVYPRNMSTRRALKLAFGAVWGQGTLLRIAQIRERVHSRFPQAAALPELAELVPLVKSVAAEASVRLEWNPDADNERGAFSVRRAPSAGPSETTLSRQHTTATRPRPGRSEFEVEAGLFENRLQSALSQGSYLVLTTSNSLLTPAEAELARRLGPSGLVPLSMEALFLKHMKAVCAEWQAEWSVVLAADAAANGSTDWNNLLALVAEAAPRVEAEIRAAAAGRTPLLTYCGMLARYHQMPLISSLQAAVGVPGGIHGVWLLLPTDEQNPLPTIDTGRDHDTVPVPVLGPAQYARIPKSWLENRHRAANIAR